MKEVVKKLVAQMTILRQREHLFEKGKVKIDEETQTEVKSLEVVEIETQTTIFKVVE